MLKVAKDKFVLLIGESKFRLSTVFKFLLDNEKSLNDCLFNETPSIVQSHCELLYDVIYKTYNSNPKSFIKSLYKDKSETANPDLYDNCARLLESLLSLFPKVSPKLVNRTAPILYVNLKFN